MDDIASAQDSWERRYAGSDSVWSGEPNGHLVHHASGIPVGRALDVGCGEGADVLWLSESGWLAQGIDFSQTAISRAAERARAAGASRASFKRSSVEEFEPEEPYDLVTASFFHPRGVGARDAFVKMLAQWVRPGGHLLLVAHGDRREGSTSGPPPVDPAEDVRVLRDLGDWEIISEKMQTREGESGLRKDSVVFARKL